MCVVVQDAQRHLGAEVDAAVEDGGRRGARLVQSSVVVGERANVVKVVAQVLGRALEPGRGVHLAGAGQLRAVEHRDVGLLVPVELERVALARAELERVRGPAPPQTVEQPVQVYVVVRVVLHRAAR